MISDRWTRIAFVLALLIVVSVFTCFMYGVGYLKGAKEEHVWVDKWYAEHPNGAPILSTRGLCKEYPLNDAISCQVTGTNSSGSIYCYSTLPKSGTR